MENKLNTIIFSVAFLSPVIIDVIDEVSVITDMEIG